MLTSNQLPEEFQTDVNYSGKILIILFYITYNLMLLFFFLAIVISYYLKLKAKLELTIMALSQIAAKHSRDLTNKW